MLMTAVELIEANPNPSRDEIREAVGGNLCRCTGYQTIVEAVELAAQRLAAAKAPIPERAKEVAQ
jgi:carbon-monoxide dehydrogenase small subunit